MSWWWYCAKHRQPIEPGRKWAKRDDSVPGWMGYKWAYKLAQREHKRRITAVAAMADAARGGEQLGWSVNSPIGRREWWAQEEARWASA